jgi:hypothetical protein
VERRVIMDYNKVENSVMKKAIEISTIESIEELKQYIK